MINHSSAQLSRRNFVLTGIALSFAPILAHSPVRAADYSERRLAAARDRVSLVGSGHPKTDVWAYNGAVPGPEIRVQQGERLRIVVENALAEETTVHWHGLRVPNAMDGVPYLTQKPIGPGETFVYEFKAVDAGTFWYHPHQRGFEQVGRGLYGPLIIEESEPVRVDRELSWVLDDWRLLKTAAISDDFGNQHDISHSGRIGNTVTINGKVPNSLAVRKGERIRLRLINAANARIFGLDFQGLKPVVIALDGQPVAPHTPADDLVVLGPAMRADIILDMVGKSGSRVSVIDRFYRGLEYSLVDLAYADAPLRDRAPDWPLELPGNPVPEPDLENADHHDIVFNGGMMGGMVMGEMGGMMGNRSKGGMMGGGGMMGSMGSMMGMMHSGKIWFINGVAAEGHIMKPVLTLERDRSHVIAMTNATSWHHPIHLHGHSFRVISRNGRPTKHREWQDTVLMAPREKVEIAFVADNPGDWMFHCHVLEHMAGGMMAVIRVEEYGKRT